MIIYSGTRAQFTRDVFANVIEEKVLAELRQRAGEDGDRNETVVIVELKLVGFSDVWASRICGSWTEEPAIIKCYLQATGRPGHSIARSLKAPALYRLPESVPPGLRPSSN